MKASEQQCLRQNLAALLPQKRQIADLFLMQRIDNKRTSCCRRTTSQPTSDNLGNLRKRIQEGTNASTKAPPSALKNTASAPPISREEWNITRPSLGAAKNAVARKLDAGKDEAGGHKSSSTPALAEAGRCMHHQASSEQYCADKQLRL